MSPTVPADLHNGDLRFAGGADAGAAFDERLDLVGDVRNHLHGAAEVLATALLANDRIVDLAGSEIVGAAHPRRHEAFVVTEVEVGFCTVLASRIPRHAGTDSSSPDRR